MADDEKELSSFRYWTRHAVKSATGFHADVVERVLAGISPVKQKGRVKYWAFRDLIIPFANYMQYGHSDAEDGDSNLDPAKMQPKNRKEHWLAEKAMDDVLLSRSQLLIRDDVYEQFAKLVKTLTAGIESIPDRLERDCGLKGHQIQTVIEVLDDIRDSLADDILYGDEVR